MPSQQRVPLFGLDGSGKTTLLYRFKSGLVISTIPTIGFNVEEITMGPSELRPVESFGEADVLKEAEAQGKRVSRKVVMWDLGGSTTQRVLWEKILRDSVNQGCFRSEAFRYSLVFVVDASAKERFDEAKKELHNIVKVALEMCSVKLLILANKSDLPGAASSDAVLSAMGIDQIPSNGTRTVATVDHLPVSAIDNQPPLARIAEIKKEMRKQGKDENEILKVQEAFEKLVFWGSGMIQAYTKM